MSRFIHSTIVPNVAITAGTVTTYDLPVNPLSHINLTLRCLNATNEATMANLLAAITTVEVLFKGSAVVSISGPDLYALDRFLLGRAPTLDNLVATDNAVRWITLPILLGRIPYLPAEAFPASQRGSLQLRITWAAAFTNFDGLYLLVQSVELPEAAPDRFLKYTTLTQTSVIGQNDIELPIGNKMHAIMTYQTTKPTTTSWNATIAEYCLLADNTQIYYTDEEWEDARGQLQLFTDPYHHIEAGAPLTTGDVAAYLWGILDVLKDGQYILDTAGLASLILRYVADDAAAIRVIPVELLTVAA
jgi:hypothetical protein